MSIFCPVRKNDQRRQGHFVFIARSNNISCSVSITEKLLAKLPVHPDQHLVCRLSSSGSSSLSAIGYSRVREIFRATLSFFVEDCHNYGTHSLSRGGASAASAAGISGELLDKYAGWKSVKSKNSYISTCDSDRLDKLNVSRAINL